MNSPVGRSRLDRGPKTSACEIRWMSSPMRTARDKNNRGKRKSVSPSGRSASENMNRSRERLNRARQSVCWRVPGQRCSWRILAGSGPAGLGLRGWEAEVVGPAFRLKPAASRPRGGKKKTSADRRLSPACRHPASHPRPLRTSATLRCPHCEKLLEKANDPHPPN